jgi:hypothetical protein
MPITLPSLVSTPAVLLILTLFTLSYYILTKATNPALRSIPGPPLAAYTKIYGVKGDFTKTAFYPIQAISWRGKVRPNLFSTRDEIQHREDKRKVAGAYGLEALLKMEPAIDACGELLLGKMGEFADRGEEVDLGRWVQYYG